MNKENNAMAYEKPEVGEILPAQENKTVQNPGPIHSPYGNTEWLQAQAQDKAYQQNLMLVEEWQNAQKDSPEYAAKLGADYSWAVLVAEAEAGGLDFQQTRQGPPVSSLA